jgi:hypothetical protein
VNSDLLEEPRAGERLLASACRFLADGGDEDLARLLATCSARVRPMEEPLLFGGGSNTVLEIFLTAPRQAYDVLTANDDDQWAGDDRCETIYRALRAPLPKNISHRITVLAELVEPEDDWRSTYGAMKPNEPPLPPPRELPAGGDHEIPF